MENLKLPGLAEETVDAIRRERTKIYIEQVRSLEQFQDKFRLLIQNRVAPGGGRLVVFVDDLDRCLPEKAIEVLEAIKLFADAPECVYLLGLDHEVIARGVDVRYKDFWQGSSEEGENPISGARYLEKIIQLPFTIPPVERAEMDAFVGGLTPDWPHAECPRVFAEGLGDNPRQIKRTVNVFLMLHRLAREREKRESEKQQGKEIQKLVEPLRLAKVVKIQAAAPELYSLLTEQPGLLRDIERYYRQESMAKEAGLAEKPGGRERETPPEGAMQVSLPEDLQRLVSRTPAVRRILTMHPDVLVEANFGALSPNELRRYFTLTRTVEAAQAAAPGAPRLVFEPQVVRVPEGEFLMGSTAEQAQQAIKAGLKEEWVAWEQPQHRVALSEYGVGRYPVTNREYQTFIQESGRQPPEGWSGAEFPQGKGDHPVVYVSWEDAVAYCAWLKEKTGKPYRLPTEAEWEKAARGEHGRVYPWGDAFDPGKANTAEGGPGDTTPAGQYSQAGGDSPYGCADMAGNVWEWCADWFAEDEYARRAGAMVKDPHGPEDGTARLLRGGSFSNLRRDARCAYRHWNYPDFRVRYFGFRVVLSPI